MSAKRPARSTGETAPSRRSAPKRLSPETRRRQIVEGAITFFAETGFEGGTRQLAERLGITQPLLYRYFPTKQDLIREVYESLFVGRWRDQWADIIGDRDRPFRERLIAFYIRYTEVISDPQWIRIYLFAGLKGLDINRWWSEFVDQNILTRICAEIRHEHGLAGIETVPLTPEESEAFWVLHGGIFYHGVRQDVYGMSPSVDREAFAGLAVDALMASLPIAARRATSRKKKKPR
jgi:AcrR family transcriptional regulator